MQEERKNPMAPVITSLAMGSTVVIGQHIGEQKPKEAGNAKLPFLFVGIACVVNIIGDLLLVGLWKLDVAGAALATVLAQLVSVILSATIIRKQKLPISFSPGQCRIYAGELKKILNIGVPIAVREAMAQITFLVINSIVNHMGLMPSAGYGIAQSAAHLKGFSADCILTCVLFGSIGYFNGRGRSIPVMIQGISSAFCTRVPVSIFMSRLPDTSLMLVGMATPVTTIYGILFFAVCFGRLKRQEARNTSSPCP